MKVLIILPLILGAPHPFFGLSNSIFQTMGPMNAPTSNLATSSKVITLSNPGSDPLPPPSANGVPNTVVHDTTMMASTAAVPNSSPNTIVIIPSKASPSITINTFSSPSPTIIKFSLPSSQPLSTIQTPTPPGIVAVSMPSTPTPAVVPAQVPSPILTPLIQPSISAVPTQIQTPIAVPMFNNPNTLSAAMPSVPTQSWTAAISTPQPQQPPPAPANQVPDNIQLAQDLTKKNLLDDSKDFSSKENPIRHRKPRLHSQSAVQSESLSHLPSPTPTPHPSESQTTTFIVPTPSHTMASALASPTITPTAVPSQANSTATSLPSSTSASPTTTDLASELAIFTNLVVPDALKPSLTNKTRFAFPTGFPLNRTYTVSSAQFPYAKYLWIYLVAIMVG